MIYITLTIDITNPSLLTHSLNRGKIKSLISRDHLNNFLKPMTFGS